MGLPPGATLVSGSIPDASQLPPGATLVSGDVPTQSTPYERLTQAGLTSSSKTGLEMLRDKLGGYIDEKDHQALLDAAQTGKAPEGQVWSTFGPRMVKGLFDKVTSALEPKNAALTAGVIAANTNPITAIPVDAALVAHGGYTAATNAPAALKGNPEAVDAALSGASEAAGGAAGIGEAGPKVPDLLNKARVSAAQKVVAPLVRKPLGATMEDARFNRNPAQAIVDEGLSGTKETMVEQASKRIGELSDSIDAQLKNHPNANAQIDAAPIIDKAIADATQAAKRVGNKSAVSRLNDLGEALKTEYGPTKGTPFEINNFKRQVGDAAHDLGAFKSTDPLESSAAAAMGDVYTGLKNAVNAQVPEVAPINNRISNLMSAKTGLTRNIALEENKSALSGLSMTNLPFKVLEKVAGSAPARTFAGNMLGSRLEMPTLKGGPADFNGARAITPDQFESSFGPEYREAAKTEPQWLYRTRDVGEKGIPNESRPNMTSSLDQAKIWLESRNKGTPQEIIRVDANSLNPEKLTARPFGEGVNWYRHEGAIPEDQVEVVVPHQAEVENE